ncbi:DinB family protein [Flavobacterium sp. SM15]|uniref:DinB family protein n=1 Tax=Flavobacterium sp. SM15 TaxID=2908005 RepID=UPI001EDA49C7|nr:DinB family protein [Flavobacterium sp. SM15]MCG2612070.1 DinB family protein [Flavobacterium sp. SM15]
MKTLDLISELRTITLQNIDFAQKLHDLPEEELNWRNDAKSWSILECLEHLNIYGSFYLPEIESTIRNSVSSSESEFNPGFLGDYFAKSMQPKAKLNKMKTFKKTDPIGSKLNRNVIDTFIVQQHKLLELLEASEKVDLNKLKTGISISKWIRIKLGDTFRFVIYHNQRHVLQAQRVLTAQLQIIEKSEA